MSRPVGVTASAVVALLGSISAVGFAGLGIASLFIQTAQPQPPNSAQAVIGGALVIAAFGAVGILTSVGLFRLRPWARTSILVFAGMLVVGSLFGLVMTAAMPTPPGFTTDTDHASRITMTAMFGIPLAIAVWWLFQFNAQSTKPAFASPMTSAASPTPLSIEIIAWVCIVGGVTSVFPLLIRTPAFLFGTTFSGWSAGVIYAGLGALQLYLGNGLLKRREQARILTIAWFGLSFIQLAVITLVPSLRQRMFDMQRAVAPEASPISIDQSTNMYYVVLAFGAMVGGTAIWFLIRERAAFARTKNS